MFDGMVDPQIWTSSIKPTVVHIWEYRVVLSRAGLRFPLLSPVYPNSMCAQLVTKPNAVQFASLRAFLFYLVVSLRLV